MSVKEPVDLGKARDLARHLDVFDMPGTAKVVRAMAGEIGQLRKAIKGAVEVLADRDAESAEVAADLLSRAVAK